MYENNFDEEEPRYGKIKVYSSLNEIEGVRIKGLKVNLYKINGISPELIQSEYTDCNGKVEFSKVPFGNYRVIQIIDKNYFNKPIYINWNEVLLDECNKNDTIYVVNTVKNMRN
ncbi:MAG: transthyretin-like protein [Clostridiales bacterium]|nr:transthyretin-like protein [Clostridiales bacterium]